MQYRIRSFKYGYNYVVDSKITIWFILLFLTLILINPVEGLGYFSANLSHVVSK